MFHMNLLPSMKYQVLFSRQKIHMKYQVLFSLINNEKVFMNVVCCSLDWYLRINKFLTVSKIEANNKHINQRRELENIVIFGTRF